MRQIQRLVLAAAAFLVLPCMATPSVEIKIRRSDVSEGVVVDVTARNTGDQVIYLLRSQTPFGLANGKLQGDWFDVRDSDGQPVRYRGRQILVRDPGRDAFVELVPGESIESRVDLAIEYDIPSDARLTIGTQVVTYTALPIVLAHGETSLAPGQMVRSNTIEVSTSADAHTVRAHPFADNVVDCTEEQKQLTSRSRQPAMNYATLSTSLHFGTYYYDPIDPAHPELPPRKHKKYDARYEYWFGKWDDAAPQEPDPAAALTENARMDGIARATYARFNADIKIVCDLCPGSDSSARAWTDAENTVHLCPANFLDPISGGITSQAGTLVHETTHFIDTKARAAVDKPGVINRATAHALERRDAVDSAANYEYFLSNVPLGR